MTKDKKLTPGLPKGFKDRYGPELELKKKIISKIERVFLSYGYEPLETPAFEFSANIGSFLADDPSNPMSDVFSFGYLFKNDPALIEKYPQATDTTKSYLFGCIQK